MRASRLLQNGSLYQKNPCLAQPQLFILTIKIDDGNTIRIVLSFKDQIAANAVRRQLRDLSRKICVTLQPIFVSKKLEQDLKPIEIKPSIVNR